MINKSNQKGFTLLELLLCIALIALLFGISLPAYYNLSLKNDLDVAKNEVAQSLGRASFLASASDSDTPWGVEIQQSNITVFKGSSYATRNIIYDEIYTTASSVTPSGLTEIVFSKQTGLPQQTGDTILTSANGQTKTITINSAGTVSY